MTLTLYYHPLASFCHKVLVALYEMQKQKDGRWRIAGCVIAPSTVQAT